jgi:hypothetical protein
VAVGSLDHPERVRTAGHYGVESRLHWDDCGRGFHEAETQERF